MVIIMGKYFIKIFIVCFIAVIQPKTSKNILCAQIGILTGEYVRTYFIRC